MNYLQDGFLVVVFDGFKLTVLIFYSILLNQKFWGWFIRVENSFIARKNIFGLQNVENKRYTTNE